MIIDGKACASTMNVRTKSKVDFLFQQHGLTPGLAVVLVGENEASQVYVRNKIRQAKEVGITSFEHRLSADASEQELLKLIAVLNRSSDVHGILVQLPLPSHIAEESVLSAIAAEKDVDGFHALNSGRLLNGDPRALVPCTPQGCIALAKIHLGENLSGKHAVVVGRSNIVGKPLAVLLLQENCTVTVVHSRSVEIEAICRLADILFVAVGRAELITAEWVKSGATVIDVGINRMEKSDGGSRLTGDVDFKSVKEVAAAITPVPGGVGPMTIAYLLGNTVAAACLQNNIESKFNSDS